MNGRGWARSARADAAGEQPGAAKPTATARASEARGTHREYAGLRTDARNAPPARTTRLFLAAVVRAALALHARAIGFGFSYLGGGR